MRALASLLTALLLAGCVALPADEEDPTPRVFATDLWECEAAVGLVPLPAARLAERVPEGWRPLQTEDVGLPDDPRGDALLGIQMARCAEGYGANLTDVSYASYFTLVEPPEAMRVEGARYHFLKWETLVQHAPLREALAGLAVPATEGFASFGPRVPGAEAFEGRFDMAGTHVLRATGPVPAYPDLAQFRLAELQPIAGGDYATWNATVETTLTVGGMTAELPPGFASRAAGGNRAEGYVLVGRASYLDAFVTLPAARS